MNLDLLETYRLTKMAWANWIHFPTKRRFLFSSLLTMKGRPVQKMANASRKLECGATTKIIISVRYFLVLRIRDVYPGSEFFPSRIPDPNFFHPGTASKNLIIIAQKNCFQALGNRIRTVHPGSWFFIYPGSRIPDPGIKKAPDPDPQHWYFL